MRARTLLLPAITLWLLLPFMALADVEIPPWGEALYDSTFITLDVQDTAVTATIEVHSAVVKLINDDYILTYERTSDLGVPLPNPEVNVSDSLIRAGWQDGHFGFQYLSHTQVEDTLRFSVKTAFRYPSGEAGGPIGWLNYKQYFNRLSDDPIWGGWGDIPMPVYLHLPTYKRITSNREVTVKNQEIVDYHYRWSDPVTGDTIEFTSNPDDYAPEEALGLNIEFQENGPTDVVEDHLTYQITPETRLTVPNLIIQEQVNVQLSEYWDTTAHTSGYSMHSDIQLEPSLARSLAPMWLWFPNDQTQNVSVQLEGLEAGGGWGEYQEGWAQDSIEFRLGQVGSQSGFYIHVPWLSSQVDNPNQTWWWTDPHLSVTVSSPWNADSCRFILITAPMDPSVIRFTIPNEFDFIDWSSPFDGIDRGPRPRLGHYFSFTGICREPGIARVVWDIPRSAPREPAPPTAFHLSSLAPNPFNNRTTIHYSLPKRTEVTFAVRDMTGRKVWDEPIQGDAGENSIALDATTLPAGVYLVELTAMGKVERMKAVLLK